MVRKMTSCTGVWPALIAAMLMAGCAEQPTYRPSPVSWPTAEQPETDSTKTPDQNTSVYRPDDAGTDAVAELLLAARTDMRAGRSGAAVAGLERALRITADNAEIYLALAEIYQQRGDSELARNMAGRGLLYCQSHEQCRELEAFTR